MKRRMRWPQRIEWLADGAAAALFGGAVWNLLAELLGSAPVALSAAVLATLACLRVLRGVESPSRIIEFPPFDVRLSFESPDELLLKDSDLLEPLASDAAIASELVLDDILEQLNADSRVVRLFDRGSMPTSEQLKARIDRHLAASPVPTAPEDASQDLHDALAELRRSLR